MRRRRLVRQRGREPVTTDAQSSLFPNLGLLSHDPSARRLGRYAVNDRSWERKSGNEVTRAIERGKRNFHLLKRLKVKRERDTTWKYVQSIGRDALTLLEPNQRPLSRYDLSRLRKTHSQRQTQLDVTAARSTGPGTAVVAAGGLSDSESESEEEKDEDGFESDPEWDTTEWETKEVQTSCAQLVEEVEGSDDPKRIRLASRMLSSLLAKHRSAREYIEDNAFNILEKAIKPESKSPDRSSRNLCVMLSVIAHHVVEKLSRIGCSAKIISCIGEEMNLACEIVQQSYKYHRYVRKFAHRYPINVRIRQKSIMLLRLGDLFKAMKEMKASDTGGDVPDAVLASYLKILLKLTADEAKDWGSKNRAMIRRNGGSVCLLGLLARQSRGIRESTGRLLTLIANDRANRMAMIDAGASECLYRMLSSDNELDRSDAILLLDLLAGMCVSIYDSVDGNDRSSEQEEGKWKVTTDGEIDDEEEKKHAQELVGGAGARPKRANAFQIRQEKKRCMRATRRLVTDELVIRLLKMTRSESIAERVGAMFILHKIVSGPAHERVVAALALADPRALDSRAMELARKPEHVLAQDTKRWNKIFCRPLCGGRFYIEVLRAKELPNMDVMGAQDPYVKIVLLNPFPGAPEGCNTVTDQTEPIMEGGTDPVWTTQHKNALSLLYPTPLVGEKQEEIVLRKWVRVFDPASKTYYFWNNHALISEIAWTRPDSWQVGDTLVRLDGSKANGMVSERLWAAVKIQCAARRRIALNRATAMQAEIYESWTEIMDDVSGHPYYFNEATEDSLWDKPKGWGTLFLRKPEGSKVDVVEQEKKVLAQERQGEGEHQGPPIFKVTVLDYDLVGDHDVIGSAHIDARQFLCHPGMTITRWYKIRGGKFVGGDFDGLEMGMGLNSRIELSIRFEREVVVRNQLWGKEDEDIGRPTILPADSASCPPLLRGIVQALESEETLESHAALKLVERLVSRPSSREMLQEAGLVELAHGMCGIVRSADVNGVHTCQGREYINRVAVCIVNGDSTGSDTDEVSIDTHDDEEESKGGQSLLDLATSGNTLIAETKKLLSQGAASSQRLRLKRRRQQPGKRVQLGARLENEPQPGSTQIFLSGLFLCLGLIGGATEAHVSHLTVEDALEATGKSNSNAAHIGNDNDIALAEAVRKSLLSCFVDDEVSALEVKGTATALVQMHCVGAVLAFLTRSHELCIPSRPEEEVETCLVNSVILQRLANVEDDVLLPYMCIDEVIVFLIDVIRKSYIRYVSSGGLVDRDDEWRIFTLGVQSACEALTSIARVKSASLQPSARQNVAQNLMQISALKDLFQIIRIPLIESNHNSTALPVEVIDFVRCLNRLGHHVRHPTVRKGLLHLSPDDEAQMCTMLGVELGEMRSQLAKYHRFQGRCHHDSKRYNSAVSAAEAAVLLLASIIERAPATERAVEPLDSSIARRMEREVLSELKAQQMQRANEIIAAEKALGFMQSKGSGSHAKSKRGKRRESNEPPSLSSSASSSSRERRARANIKKVTGGILLCQLAQMAAPCMIEILSERPDPELLSSAAFALSRIACTEVTAHMLFDLGIVDVLATLMPREHSIRNWNRDSRASSSSSSSKRRTAKTNPADRLVRTAGGASGRRKAADLRGSSSSTSHKLAKLPASVFTLLAMLCRRKSVADEISAHGIFRNCVIRFFTVTSNPIEDARVCAEIAFFFAALLRSGASVEEEGSVTEVLIRAGCVERIRDLLRSSFAMSKGGHRIRLNCVMVTAMLSRDPLLTVPTIVTSGVVPILLECVISNDEGTATRRYALMAIESIACFPLERYKSFLNKIGCKQELQRLGQNYQVLLAEEREDVVAGDLRSATKGSGGGGSGPGRDMRSIGELCRDVLSRLVAATGEGRVKERADTAEEELNIVKSKIGTDPAKVNLASTEMVLEKVKVTPWGRDVRDSTWKPVTITTDRVRHDDQERDKTDEPDETLAHTFALDTVRSFNDDDQATLRRRFRFSNNTHSTGRRSPLPSHSPTSSLHSASLDTRGVKFLSCGDCDYEAKSFSDLQLHFALVHMRSDAKVPKGSVRSRNELEGVSDPGEVVASPFKRPVTAPMPGAARARRRRRRKRKKEGKKRRPVFTDPTFTYPLPLSPKPWLRSSAKVKSAVVNDAEDEKFSHTIRVGNTRVDVRVVKKY